MLPYVPRLVVDWLRTTPEVLYRPVEGSLVFVDISGFTKLAERLAKKGKVGAEELSDTLNATFAELLSVAYDYGAGVIKWGGDAVLLLYDGDDHEARACRGAAEMQRAIRRVGRIRTESGTVVLRMSIGVNTGVFDFFLVGESHRELLIAGSAATETTLLEADADAGEVGISPATAAQLPARNVGAAKGPGFLLRGLPAAFGLERRTSTISATFRSRSVCRSRSAATCSRPIASLSTARSVWRLSNFAEQTVIREGVGIGRARTAQLHQCGSTLGRAAPCDLPRADSRRTAARSSFSRARREARATTKSGCCEPSARYGRRHPAPVAGGGRLGPFLGRFALRTGGRSPSRAMR